MKLGFSLSLWVMQGHNYDNFHKFLDDLALLGYDGAEFAYPFVREIYGGDPRELGRLMALHGLEIASTYVGVDFSTPEGITAGEEQARDSIDFYSSLGCRHFLLDATGENPKKDEGHRCMFTYDDRQLALAAEASNRIGAYARRAGMQLSWHTHCNTFYEDQPMFQRFWDQTDPDLVRLCPDVGQCLLVGVDPVRYVKDNLSRITHYVHYKDIDLKRPARELWLGKRVPDDMAAYTVDAKGRWIELGRGDVDFPSVTDALLGAGYDGWITCDLDCSPYVARDSAGACKEYLNKGLGIIGDRDKAVETGR